MDLSTYGSGDHPADATLVEGVVLKSAGPWGPAVIALLRHLEQTGFAGAPRVAGDHGYAPDGRLAVSYVPGESPHPGPWPPGAAGRVGELLRDLHTATRGFTPPPGARWQDISMPLPDAEPVIGHRDTGPWNIVAFDGRLSLIDWERAGPVDPLTELAEAVWLNAQLHDDDIAERHALPDAAARAAQAREIVDGYRLGSADRVDFVDRLLDVAVHSARAEALAYGVHPESSEALTADGYPVLWGIAWRARSASWIARHRALLRRALTRAG